MKLIVDLKQMVLWLRVPGRTYEITQGCNVAHPGYDVLRIAFAWEELESAVLAPFDEEYYNVKP